MNAAMQPLQNIELTLYFCNLPASLQPDTPLFHCANALLDKFNRRLHQQQQQHDENSRNVLFALINQSILTFLSQRGQTPIKATENQTPLLKKILSLSSNCMFSCAWHYLHLLPHRTIVVCFSRVWHLLHVFLFSAETQCFPALCTSLTPVSCFYFDI